jgi:xylulokinase
MLPKDFLKLRLCGEITTDYSDASGTLAFDIERFAWSRNILDALGIPADMFPPCYGSDYAVCRVTKKAAAETGLAPGTSVVNGGGDQIMQAIGNGAIRPGQATVNIGSSGQVCFQSAAPIRNPRLSTNTFCGYGKNRWITMGATMTAGLALTWISRLAAGGDYQKTDEEIAGEAPGSGGLIFLPSLNGERTPYMNADLSGMFMGLSLNTGRLQMIQAVMEGVAYSLNQCIEVCGELGLHARELIASGGGARSSTWLQMQADIFNVPLKITVTEEQAGMGAAAAAGVGAGIFASVEEACGTLVHYRDTIWEPNAAHHRVYEQYYGLFKDAYAASGQTLQSLTRLGRSQREG